MTMPTGPDSRPVRRNAAECARMLQEMLADPELVLDAPIRQRLTEYQGILASTGGNDALEDVLERVDKLLTRIAELGAEETQTSATAVTQAYQEYLVADRLAEEAEDAMMSGE